LQKTTTKVFLGGQRKKDLKFKREKITRTRLEDRLLLFLDPDPSQFGESREKLDSRTRRGKLSGRKIKRADGKKKETVKWRRRPCRVRHHFCASCRSRLECPVRKKGKTSQRASHWAAPNAPRKGTAPADSRRKSPRLADHCSRKKEKSGGGTYERNGGLREGRRKPEKLRDLRPARGPEEEKT